MGPETIIFAMTLTLSLAYNVRESNNAGFHHRQNEVLALREELKVDGLEEDSTFHGGKGVDHWITLPSHHDTYLIGVKRRGLSLISISKRIGSLFQAVERQTDLEEDITSVVAFNYVSPDRHWSENIVAVAVGPPKHEIIWFKIYNYKLVRFWSWVRYSPTLSLHHFKVLREDRLLILDSSGQTAFLYSLAFGTPTPNIRELEVLSFRQKVLGLATSLANPEPFLYALHQDGISIYTYKRLCSESALGVFLKQAALRKMGAIGIYPFLSEGREYLAVAGAEAGLFSLDPLGNIYQEIRMDNIQEWLIMKTGSHKQGILLFGKTSRGEVKVFSNVGQGWSQYEAPPCYKQDKGTQRKIETHGGLTCLSNKPWAGVASLEIGDLPTLIFGVRKFYGEIYHVLLSLKRDVLPLYGQPQNPLEFSSDLMRMKSNIEDVVSKIGSSRSSDGTCSVYDMLTRVEDIVANAKKTISETCSPNINTPMKDPSPIPLVSSAVKDGQDEVRDARPISIQGNARSSQDEEHYEETESHENVMQTPQYPMNGHKIAPELDLMLSQDSNDLNGDYRVMGLPKKPDNLVS